MLIIILFFTGKQLEDAANTIHKFLHRVDPQDASEYVQVMQVNINEYSAYRYI